MKLSISRSTVSTILSIGILGFSASNAFADSVIMHGTPDSNEVFSAFSAQYFGNAAYVNEYALYTPSGFGVVVPPPIKYSHEIVLPGYQKRYRVFKLQTSTDGLQNGPRKDLVFQSKEDAENFCKVLGARTLNKFSQQELSPDSQPNSIYVWDKIWPKRVIAVGYSIAYGAGSQPTADGKSTPAQKHVFCANPWNWQPDGYWDDENEATGIKESVLNDNAYEVTCMNVQKPKATFWLSADAKWANKTQTYTINTVNAVYPTLHELNEKVGAPYCNNPR